MALPPCRLYLGTESGLRTVRVNGPNRIEQWASTLDGETIRSLAVHPTDPDSVYVGCGLRGWGLHRTDDGGRTAESVGFEDVWVWGVTIGPTDPETVYVGSEPPMLYRSRDSGETWTEFESIDDLPSRDDWELYHEPFGDGHVHGLSIHPDRPERLVAGVEDGTGLYSHDGGDTWHETLVGEDVHRTAFDPTDSERVLAGCASGLYVSDDAGKTWDAVPSLAGEYIHGINFDPHLPDRVVLYATDEPVLYRSPDSGETWDPLPADLPSGRAADPLAFHPSTEDVVFYAGGEETGELYMTTDGGDCWRRLADDLPKVWRVAAVAGV